MIIKQIFQIQIVICLCIGSALANPVDDKYKLLDPKPINDNIASNSDESSGTKSILHSLEPQTDEAKPFDFNEESLQFAASAHGGGGYGGGWGGGHGGGWGGGYGGGRGWGGGK